MFYMCPNITTPKDNSTIGCYITKSQEKPTAQLLYALAQNVAPPIFFGKIRTYLFSTVEKSGPKLGFLCKFSKKTAQRKQSPNLVALRPILNFAHRGKH
jgi:hypothetical protein